MTTKTLLATLLIVILTVEVLCLPGHASNSDLRIMIAGFGFCWFIMGVRVASELEI